MYQDEEKRLADYKKTINEASVPLQALDDAINAGLQKAKLEEKQKPRKNRWLMTLVAAAILLVGFFTSIRFSPTFANYVTVIPGMEKVVELIRRDKGLITAIENDYYQKIGVSDEKNGLKVIIDGAIADENGLILFYTLQSNEKKKEMVIKSPDLKYKNGEKVPNGASIYGDYHHSEEGQNIANGKMEYYFVEKTLKSKEFDLTLKVKADKQIEKFYLPFTLSKDLKVKKVIKINQTATIEGQKINFVKVTIYPLRVAVHVKKDPNNTKALLYYEDLRLVDENGEAWGKVDGFVGSGISDNEEIIYLQSNYFREPKELYLVINKIQAINKEERNLVVDLQKKQILKQPDGNKLRNVRIEGNDLVFDLHSNGKFSAFIFGEIKDGDGKNIESKKSFSSGNYKGVKEVGVNIPKIKKQKSPISIKLYFYPSWIEGDVKIKIK